MTRRTLCAALVALSLASVALGQTITVVKDSRSGSLYVSDGVGPPFEYSFSTNPDVLNGPISCDKTFCDGRSCDWYGYLNSLSDWICPGPANSATGFAVSGEVAAVAPSSGLVSSEHHINVSFVVAGAPSGLSMTFFAGATLYGTCTFSMTLTGPGVDLDLSVGEVVLNLSDGEYTLKVDVDSSQVPAQAIYADCSFSAGFATSLLCTTMIAGPIIDPMTGHRYGLVDKSTWSDAKAKAAVWGAQLLTINSLDENNFVHDHVYNNIPGVPVQSGWLGLNDIASEGTFVWDSGEPVTFTHWLANQPNNYLNVEDAAEMLNTGFWNDANPALATYAAIEFNGHPGCGAGGGSCFSAHRLPGCDTESCCNLICGIDGFCCTASWDATCADMANKVCDPGIVIGPIYNPVTHHRYYLLDTCAWPEGEKKARALNGHLVTINDLIENNWLVSNFVDFAGADRRCFIGLNDQATEGAFQWVDGSPDTFTNWASNEPNNAGSGEQFAEITSGSGGQWNDNSITAGTAFTTQAIVEVPCHGDFDNNGGIDGGDLAQLLGAWGGSSTMFDLDADGAVGGADLAMLLGAWGPCGTTNCCSAHRGVSCDQPGCAECVCIYAPECCETSWDEYCVTLALNECWSACACQ